MKYSVLIAERRGAASIEDAERLVGGEGTQCYVSPEKPVGWFLRFKRTG